LIIQLLHSYKLI